MKRIYWDSNCFLHYLKGEPEVKACRQVIDKAEDGEIAILTSALAMAEVVKLRKYEKIPREDRERIHQAFSEDYIVLRDVTVHIAKLSQEYIWEYNFSAKDGVHVATCVDAGVVEFHTFDNELIAKSGETSVNGKPLIIRKPGLE